MPTASKPIAPLPRQDVPFLDQRTGNVNIEWYRWLKAMDECLRQVRAEIP